MGTKENDEFSSAVLLLAVVLYVTVGAAVFAALVVTKPDVGSAIAVGAKDYGAIIAGVPVLIAVWVAKQQLDANRRQHVANVKRSFQKELDALGRLERFAEAITHLKKVDIAPILGKSGFVGLWVSRPLPNDLKKWKEFLPSEITSYADETWLRCGELMDAARSADAEPAAIKKQLDVAQLNAEILMKNVRVYRDDLSQYW